MQEELQKIIVGQADVIEQIFAAVFTRGHCLLEGVPGLAKTLMVSTLARILDIQFKRIQFTPDLMPSDITGTNVLEEDEAGRRNFRFVEGPVFTNILLADEINRTPPKTQAALLQAMQEREVTVGKQTYPLPDPFFTIATQNPIEQEGTYPLPEAQLDRFMMEIHIGYPTAEQEEEIVMRTTAGAQKLPDAALSREEFLRLRDLVLAVPVAPNVAALAVRLCRGSRPAAPQASPYIKDYVAWGAGPRGSQNLVLAAKARALLLGRSAPIAEDIRLLAAPILRHRIIVNHRAVGDGINSDGVVERLLTDVV
jgi:MoxR-like ATPase